MTSPGASPADQYRAATSGCAVFDLSDREQIALTGRDRAAFLHNFCTQEIKRLPVGSGAEAFVTNIKGRILGHVLVFAEEEALWLDGPAGTAAVLLPHLKRYLITEDVEVTDRSAELGELLVTGPAAASAVDALLPGAGALAVMQHCRRADRSARRVDILQRPGWLLLASRGALRELAEQLRAVGAVGGSAAVLEALRIEAGFPVYGRDLTDDNLAQEAGRTRQAISFTKGCYLGQEPIARLDALGHTNRELRGLRLAGGVVTASGACVQQYVSGADVGVVTSSALHPVDGSGLALGLLRREVCEPGSRVTVDTAGGPAEAVVFGFEPSR